MPGGPRDAALPRITHVNRPADHAASVRTRLAHIARDERTTTEEFIVRYARAPLFYPWPDEPHRPTDIESVEAEEIREDSGYGGVRVKFYTYLGRARPSLQVDVGIGDASTPGPLTARYPTLLADFFGSTSAHA